ncbi:hypothetical protein [Paenibacillus harenae]|uniref:hypothetical protein n=1 Tax=Paenibacillus harenae TaxID=306543 RepID=UPI002793DF2A|nr:hypothetical protein [Paenibacillus harenae]MDQ0059453.1 hypothetical protein [Paenibacillus harenae]
MDTVTVTIDQLDKMSQFISDKLDYCIQKDEYPEFRSYYDTQLETIRTMRDFMVEQFATGIDSYFDLARHEPNQIECMLFSAKEVTKQIEVAQAKTKHYVKESFRANNFKGPEHLKIARDNLAIWAKNSADKNNVDSVLASHASYKCIVRTIDAPFTNPIKEKIAKLITSAKSTIKLTVNYNLMRQVFPDQEIEIHYTKAIAQSEETIKLLENIIGDINELRD